jgi:hypothetical protein
LYLRVMDAQHARRGIADHIFAITQLAQTTLRSEIGKIDLDRTFEERGAINTNIVLELDKATEPWGVKVLRYEIKNINPPHDVLSAMEKQKRAEREKRAVVLTSEGERDAKINERKATNSVIKASEASTAADQRSAGASRGDSRGGNRYCGRVASGRIRTCAEGGHEAMQLRGPSRISVSSASSRRRAPRWSYRRSTIWRRYFGRDGDRSHVPMTSRWPDWLPAFPGSVPIPAGAVSRTTARCTTMSARRRYEER